MTRREDIVCDDWKPTAPLKVLRQRAGLLARLRRFFDREGFLEVETPLLSRDVVVDAHLDPFVLRPDAGDAQLFLQTSPEFAMKRLLAAGVGPIYQVARAFRQGERGALHNPEFTIVEWYRPGDDHFAQMTFVERLVADLHAGLLECANLVERPNLESHEPRPLDWSTPFERTTYDDAFLAHAGSRVLHLSAADLARLANELNAAAPATLEADDRDGRLNLLLAERVEPQLGRLRPTFLYDYPASQAALARIRPDDPPVAERFELYIDGIEMANGYHELTDADELRRRAAEQNRIRTQSGLATLPERSRLLDAMNAGLPACAGVALGFDRLVMLLLGAATIAEVCAFPIDRA